MIEAVHGQGRTRNAIATFLVTVVLSGVPAAFVSSAGVATAGSELLGSPAAQTRLVLLLVIDQLRRDRLMTSLPGGLGRIAREGRVYLEAEVAHAVTETCPGHVTVLSGRYPGPAGIPSNTFIDRESGDSHYCVEDRSPDARVIGGSDAPKDGRSPRNIRVAMLGEWLKQISPASRVMSVSGKDRAAITTVGRGADAAYWLLRPVGFSTSRYYMYELPEWVRRWNGSLLEVDGLLSELPVRWSHTIDASQSGGRPDDFHAESGSLSRTSGHPLREGNRREVFSNLYRSPFLDDLTLDFALELVDQASLGRRGVTDLLAVSLSATDTVGHTYGPESHEARDALLRLDSAVGRFLAELESKVGGQGLLVVLTADHGVLPIPEWLAETGRSRCPVEGGRQGLAGPLAMLMLKLQTGVGPVISVPPDWFESAGTSIHINRGVARERGRSPAAIAELISEHLEGYDAIEEVWTREEILTGEGKVAELQRRSFDPERSGDIRLQVTRDCLLQSREYGTTHGSPHGYDREVPLVFMGPGVVPGETSGRAATVDVAPTLAHHLGIPLPDGLDGRVLPLTQPAAISLEGRAEQALDGGSAHP